MTTHSLLLLLKSLHAMASLKNIILHKRMCLVINNMVSYLEDQSFLYKRPAENHRSKHGTFYFDNFQDVLFFSSHQLPVPCQHCARWLRSKIEAMRIPAEGAGGPSHSRLKWRVPGKGHDQTSCKFILLINSPHTHTQYFSFYWTFAQSQITWQHVGFYLFEIC